MDQQLLAALGEQSGLDLMQEDSFEKLRLRLAEKIETLIDQDFQELIYILYRVGVDENKLKFLLKEKVGEDAALIISDLLIERQMQKIKTRQQFQQTSPGNEEKNPDDEEEKW